MKPNFPYILTCLFCFLTLFTAAGQSETADTIRGGTATLSAEENADTVMRKARAAVSGMPDYIGDIWPEAPHAARLREVSMPTPALSTGACVFQVPLYTLKVGEVTLPFSLQYHSNGIMVEDDPFPVGYGWTFLPALRITRKINGRPDEKGTRTIPEGTRRGDAEVHHADMYRSMADEHKCASTILDPEYDLFTVYLPDRTLNAYYSGGSLISPGNREYKISAKDSFTGFTVTGPDGVIWDFSTRGGFDSGYQLTEWALTDVTLPDGKKIGFTWQRGRHLIQSNSNTYIQETFYVMPMSGGGMAKPALDGKKPCGRPFAEECMNLTDITFPGGTVNFTYGAAGQHASAVLKTMAVKYGDSTVESITFAHDIVTHDAPLLKSVTLTDGSSYTFGYDGGRFTKLEDQDYWGYYNGKNNTYLMGPSMTVDVFGARSESRPLIGADRRVDTAKMKAMILERAVHPTGAVTEWEYEPHSFPTVSFREPGITATKDATLTAGGGLRVKKMRMLEKAGDPSPRTVSYLYGKDGDGNARLECAPVASTFLQHLIIVAPRFTMEDPQNAYPYICEYGDLVLGPHSNCNTKSYGDVPVWYEEVTEIHGEGKTVHHYIKPAVNHIAHLELGRVAPDSVATWFSGGVLESSTEIYRMKGGAFELAEKTEYTHDTEYGENIVSVHIARFKAQSTIVRYSPDFGEGMCLNFPLQVIPDDDYYPTPINGCDYCYLDQGIYTPYIYDISTAVTRLKSVRTTLHTSNLPYTVTREYTCLGGTRILLSQTEKTSVQSVKTEYAYADPATPAGASMIAANVVGLPVSGSVTCGTSKTEWSAAMKSFNAKKYFRPSSISLRRGSGQYHELSSYTYYPDGKLKTVLNSGEPGISYTWDTYGRYPLTMTVGNTLTSVAEWKPLVGVKSLTDPAGMKTTYTYDTANRLSSVSVNGNIRESYSYRISHDGDNSVTSGKYTSSSAYFSTVERYDALGRLSASYTETPGGWVASLREYDAMGRPWRDWIPVLSTSSQSTPDALRQQAMSDYDDSKPYREVRYEASPRGVAEAETKEGEAWHDNGKSKVTEVFANDSQSHRCNRYTVTSGGVTKNGLWPDASLLVTLVTDEDGITLETYRDLRGLTVCEKRGGAATYHVYDDYGDLRYILPPGVENGGQRTSSDMKDIAYWYDYDGRGRCVTKKLPGAKEHLLRYDPDGRLVAERTHNHPGNTWRIYAYDNCGRIVVTLDCRMTEAEVSEYVSETRRASLSTGGTMAGYSLTPEPSAKVTGGKVVTASFYDDYSFIEVKALGSAYSFRNPVASLPLSSRIEQTGSVCTSAADATGKLTGVYTGQGWEVYYYDTEGREIQRYATGYNRGYRVTVYNYDGSVASVHHCYNSSNPDRPPKPSGSGLRDRDIYHSYDRVGRLVKTRILERYFKPGASKTDSAVLAYRYDSTGRLESVKQGSVSRNIGYDIHGWTSRISTILNGSDYLEELKYAGTPKPRYNGFISQRKWNGNTYSFTYDKRGFLTNSAFKGKEPYMDFSEWMEYDDRGNMTAMQRMGVIDILPSGKMEYGVAQYVEATYEGNRMTEAHVESDTEVFDRRSGLYEAGDALILYDDSGRVTGDESRGLQGVTYDNDGYPLQLNVDYGGYTIFHTRDGLGNRLSTEVVETGIKLTTVEENRYTGDGHVIRDGVLVMSRFPGGYFDADLKPHYYITDYQGNIVGVHDGKGNLEQQMDYYPYGEPWLEPEYTESGSGNRYLFGGKERIFAGRINEYDFHARTYLGSQCRFSTIDPLTEKTPWLSPYTFCASNPVNFTDPDGRQTFAVHGTFSSNATWKDKEGINRYTHNKFGDNLHDYDFNWFSGNLSFLRTYAANKLVKYISKARKGISKKEPITIVGHSHGGNVGIMAINVMVNMAEFDGIQINLLTINTPVRKDTQLSGKARQKVTHVNVFDSNDPIQTIGGNITHPEFLFGNLKIDLIRLTIGELGPAERIFENADENISVNNPQPFIKWHGPFPWFGDFHNSHNRVFDWENK